jgi:Helicase HerA, central domain
VIVQPAPGDRTADAVHHIASALVHHPWLVAVPAALYIAGTAVHAAWLNHQQTSFAAHPRYLTILPPPEVDPAGTEAWWANAYELLNPRPARRRWRGIPHLALEYNWSGRRLVIGVWIPGTVPSGPIVAAIRAAWPGATASPVEPAPPLPAAALAVGGTLWLALPAWYPLNTDHDADPLRPLIAAASNLSPAEHACVQVLARPATPRRSRHLRRGARAARTGQPPQPGLLNATGAVRALLDLATPGSSRTHPGQRLQPDPLRERAARAAIDKATAVHWEVSIRYGVAHTNPHHTPETNLRPRLVTIAHGIGSAYGTHTGANRLRRGKLPQPTRSLAVRSLRRGSILSTVELATLAGLPLDLAVPGLDRARAKAAPAPIAVPSGGRDIRPLGRAELGGQAVGLPVADGRQHLHVLGATGSGKSTAMTHLILSDVHAHRGVVVIDPRGDLATDLLERLPPAAIDRLVLLDPDQPGGATLNPLAGEDHDLIVDNVVSIFSKIFQRHWGPRIDDVLRVACLTLMRRTNATLTLIPPLLNDKQFRAAFTVELDDPEGLRGFWEWYESTSPALRAQIIGPVLARLRAFLLRDFVRRTLGTPRSSFDMGRVLDGGLLIARLPKGQLGEETAKLMSSFVFASVWQAAIARSRRPEATRRDAAVYVDEAQNVLNLAGSVDDMLAEARGYHLGLVLAHQNLSQLPRETQLAFSANARNKLYFNCSPEDAHQLARHTLPELDQHDLSHLDAFTAAARLVISSRETPAFTAKTPPPKPPINDLAELRRALAEKAATNGRRTQPAQADDSDEQTAEPVAE